MDRNLDLTCKNLPYASAYFTSMRASGPRVTDSLNVEKDGFKSLKFLFFKITCLFAATPTDKISFFLQISNFLAWILILGLLKGIF